MSSSIHSAILQARDRASRVFSTFARRSAAEMRKMSSDVNRVKGQIQAMMGAFAVGAAVGRLKDLSRAMGQFVSAGASLDAIAQRYQELTALKAPDLGLNELTDAAGGAISRFNAMRAVNKGLMLDLPLTNERMRQMGQASIVMGQAMDRSANEALGDLVLGLGRASPLILDNIGIKIRAREAYKQYGAQIGKTVEQLTEEEKKLAIFNIAMDRSAELVARLGPITGNTKQDLDALKASFEDVVQSMAAATAGSDRMRFLIQSLDTAVENAVFTFLRWRTVLEQLIPARLFTELGMLVDVMGGDKIKLLTFQRRLKGAFTYIKANEVTASVPFLRIADAIEKAEHGLQAHNENLDYGSFLYKELLDLQLDKIQVPDELLKFVDSIRDIKVGQFGDIALQLRGIVVEANKFRDKGLMPKEDPEREAAMRRGMAIVKEYTTDIQNLRQKTYDLKVAREEGQVTDILYAQAQAGIAKEMQAVIDKHEAIKLKHFEMAESITGTLSLVRELRDAWGETALAAKRYGEALDFTNESQFMAAQSVKAGKEEQEQWTDQSAQMLDATQQQRQANLAAAAGFAQAAKIMVGENESAARAIAAIQMILEIARAWGSYPDFVGMAAHFTSAAAYGKLAFGSSGGSAAGTSTAGQTQISNFNPYQTPETTQGGGGTIVIVNNWSPKAFNSHIEKTSEEHIVREVGRGGNPLVAKVARELQYQGVA